MQIINGYRVDETKGFQLKKGKSEKTFATYAEAVEFMRLHYGYTLTYNFIESENEK